MGAEKKKFADVVNEKDRETDVIHVSIIENKYKNKEKKLKQYSVKIPTKFARMLKLTRGDKMRAVVVLPTKRDNEITLKLTITKSAKQTLPDNFFIGVLDDEI